MALLALGPLAGSLAACTNDHRSPEEAVARYLASWAGGEESIRGASTGPQVADLIDAVAVVREHLADIPMLDDASTDGDTVTGVAVLSLRGGVELRLAITAEVVDGAVRAAPSAFERSLTDWPALEIDRTDTAPGRLLDRNGEALDHERDASLRAAVAPVFRETLRGRPSYRLTGDGDVLAEVAARPPTDVRLALDPPVQEAAVAAIGQGRRQALVAVDAATGEIVAFAGDAAGDRPLGASAVPVGSVFKVATATAVLLDGRSPEDRVPCPAAEVVQGRAVVNASRFDLGELTIRRALALSCNTSFALLGAELGGEAVLRAASTLGFGARIPGVDRARLSEPDSGEDEAALGFGAGDTEISAVALASGMATLGADGLARSPRWDRGVSAGERVLPQRVARQVVAMMRDAVESGTAQEAAGEGADVAAKTGTPRRIVDGEAVDDGLTVAVVEVDGRVLGVAAVVVEGQTGSRSAAPLVGRFVRSLET